MKGATPLPDGTANVYLNFNPRTHEGCDVDLVERVEVFERISIHAPMKGATLYS